MAHFALKCLAKTNELVKQLEVTLGPGTSKFCEHDYDKCDLRTRANGFFFSGDLTMRLGMHSGPVTAGVLRGDRARFQLFGDTGTHIMSQGLVGPTSPITDSLFSK